MRYREESPWHPCLRPSCYSSEENGATACPGCLERADVVHIWVNLDRQKKRLSLRRHYSEYSETFTKPVSSLIPRAPFRPRLLLVEPLCTIITEPGTCSPLPSATWKFSLRVGLIYSLSAQHPCDSKGQLAGTAK